MSDYVVIEEAQLVTLVDGWMPVPGPAGPPGTAILGILDDPSQLPPTGAPGDAYIVDGDLWLWTAETGWYDGGPFPVGPQGPPGPAGAAGAAGSEGPTGPTGPQGVPGAAGPQGVQGIPGAAGPTGATGATGPTGTTGATGATGPAGAQGIQGVPGPTGPQGPPGTGGTGGTGADEVWVSPTAPTDPAIELWIDTDDEALIGVGPVGPQGPAGPTGPAGATGATGANGPQGPAGPTGAAGAAGTAGATGAEGPTGPAGATGATGAQGPNGPTGPQGPQGVKGDTGAQGPAGSGAPDATALAKGSVQLAGDLGGTAAAPTVPRLALKADSDGSRSLDSFTGANDDAKLTAALAWQQSTAGKPAIRLAARRHDFNVSRILASGTKLVGAEVGAQDTQVAGGQVPTWIRLGAAIGTGASAWWVCNSTVYDVYFSNFAVEGDGGGGSGFVDSDFNSGGNLYRCSFHSLAFNYMNGVFGTYARSCAMTATTFTGDWSCLNFFDTPFHIGGSDCCLWKDSLLNLGPSGATTGAQSGARGVDSYQVIFESLSKTDVGYIFCSPLTNWRGVKVTGAASELSFFGGTYEGYKPGVQGGVDKRAIGTVMRLEGGVGSFHGTRFGQCMRSPDATEGGYVHITGGEWSFFNPQFYRGDTASTVPCIYQTGGRVAAYGASYWQTETWANRPVLETGAPSPGTPNSGSYASYCPDLSMNVT